MAIVNSNTSLPMKNDRKNYTCPRWQIRAILVEETWAVNSVLFQPNPTVNVEWIEEDEEERFLEF